jgi:hypothetical protein
MNRNKKSTKGTMVYRILLFAILAFPQFSLGMSDSTFWEILENANKNAGRDLVKVPDFLRKKLLPLSKAEIVEFKDVFQGKLCEAHTWPLWGAAYIINGGASDDGFDYFKMALIAAGKSAFETGLRNPDDLSGVKLTKIDGYFELEEIDYVPDEAYKAKTGNDLDYKPKVSCLEPKGKAWQENELPKMYPKLAKKYM